MFISLALIAAGAIILAIGVYFWKRPDQYYRYLQSSSGLASIGVRPAESLVRFGAALTVMIGAGVLCWGIRRLIF
jgi:hypothetical protein